MSEKTTLELLEDNLNKHMAICDLKRKVKMLQAENVRLRNLAKDIYERSKTQMNKDDWEFLFQMPAAKGVQS